ncbi:hypothetical protein J2W27_004660 [Variovorax boronicumulans]|uniref:hypothetical protein n=1 Tax=Variovorax boronicumulans TaxID=436515 RepID=UPI0027828FD1|nr:hypothetical protein [Variovorax boronicumulans]MDP9912534.1 hypothetical protein [Variovorax boronicumulans]
MEVTDYFTSDDGAQRQHPQKMPDTHGTLQLHGRPVPSLLRADMGIEVTVPNATWTSGRLPASAVNFWISISVDESSGEDGAPAPMVQSLPVLRMTGSVPLLSELPGLSIDESQDDWDAWYGNDAPALIENHLTFGPWMDDHIAVCWEARVEDWCSVSSEGPKPGRLRFEGALRLKHFTAHTADPDNADAWMCATWGKAMIASCQREEGPWCNPVPVFGGRWKAVWYRPTPALSPI